MRTLHFRRANITVGDEPPTEFRVFVEGENDSTKGADVFDAEAAKRVIEEYTRHGVDVMIDLEHLSLDREKANYDPDARGWCKLEMRGGELWAVDVRWTPDGAERIKSKRQRYISPAFYTDDSRVDEVVNLALTALPATHNAAPLVAANRSGDDMAAKPKTRAEDGAPDEKPKVDEAQMKRLAQVRKLMGLPDDGADVAEAVAALKPEAVVEVLMAAADAIDAAASAGEMAPPMDEGDQMIAAAARALTKLSKEPAPRVVAELARLSSGEGTTDDREQLIAANLDKIPEAMMPLVRKWSRADLSEYLKHAPKTRSIEKPDQSRVQPPQANHERSVELTEADRYVIKLGLDTEERMIAQRKRELGGAQ